MGTRGHYTLTGHPLSPGHVLRIDLGSSADNLAKRSPNGKSAKYVPWEPYKCAVTKLTDSGHNSVAKKCENECSQQLQERTKRLPNSTILCNYNITYVDKRLLAIGDFNTNYVNHVAEPPSVSPDIKTRSPLLNEQEPDMPFQNARSRKSLKIMPRTVPCSDSATKQLDKVLETNKPNGFQASIFTDFSQKMSEEERRTLNEEKENLVSQLHIQLQVNAELKKLLVASLGEDLNEKFDCLIQAKARLAHEVSYCSHHMSSLYDQLEKLSIQCDVWRSKFMASRLMLNDVSHLKGLLCQKYQTSQEVLRQLLQEHQDMKNHLIETYRYLRGIQKAFDPSHQATDVSIVPSNLVELILANQKLADTIKQKLLGNNHRTRDAADFNLNATAAEHYALQVLTNQFQMDSSHVPVLPASYHVGNYELIAFDRCHNCSGEIFVV